MRSGTTSTTELRSVAVNDAVRNGFADVTPHTLTLNVPPLSGSHVGNANAVEVIVSRRIDAFFAKVMGISSTTMSARAVVAIQAAEACVLALHSSASRALNIDGSTTVNAPTCVMASNSTSASGTLSSRMPWIGSASTSSHVVAGRSDDVAGRRRAEDGGEGAAGVGIVVDVLHEDAERREHGDHEHDSG